MVSKGRSGLRGGGDGGGGNDDDDGGGSNGSDDHHRAFVEKRLKDRMASDIEELTTRVGRRISKLFEPGVNERPIGENEIVGGTHFDQH